MNRRSLIGSLPAALAVIFAATAEVFGHAAPQDHLVLDANARGPEDVGYDSAIHDYDYMFYLDGRLLHDPWVAALDTRAGFIDLWNTNPENRWQMVRRYGEVRVMRTLRPS